jgi:hypothetical protein
MDGQPGLQRLAGVRRDGDGNWHDAVLRDGGADKGDEGREDCITGQYGRSRGTEAEGRTRKRCHDARVMMTK